MSLPMMSWPHSSNGYGTINTCTEQTFGSSSASHLHSPSYCMIVRHRHSIMTWRAGIDAFCIKCLQRIMECCWNDFILNPQLICVTELRPISCIIHQHQLMLSCACGMLPRSQSCLLSCTYERALKWEDQGVPIQLWAWASQWMLLGGTQNSKEAYKDVLGEASINGAVRSARQCATPAYGPLVNKMLKGGVYVKGQEITCYRHPLEGVLKSRCQRGD